MREYNTVDPLADIKYWWRYEAYPIDRFGIGVFTGLFIFMAFHLVTLEPNWRDLEPNTPPSLLYDKDDYVDLTAKEIQELPIESRPTPIPINPKYADYISHQEPTKFQKLKPGAKPKKTSRSGGANFLKKKSERKISSAKHKRSDRSAPGNTTKE